MRKAFAFEQLQRMIGGACSLERGFAIDGLATLSSAGPRHLSFLTASKYREQAASTRAAAVLIRASDVDLLPATSLPWVVEDPYLAYASLSACWQFRSVEQDSSRSIAADARLGEGVILGPGATVGAAAVIGDRVRVGAGAHIGAHAVIGSDTELRAGVVIEHACQLGQYGLVHANTVIGSDGFGFARNAQRQWVKIHQLGTVRIGNFVEIGAHCSIDRGALDDTVISNGTKLDNQIQIAHNVVIGEDCALAGCVGIAGSTSLGDRVMVGGGAGILGHLRIADDVVIAAMSLIAQSIPSAGAYGGAFPQMPQKHADRSAAVLKQLPSLRSRLMQLERLVDQPSGERSE
ncbi:MAG: UDP-3-O-(3-hydroxymyristoyl)glucosamine N-acyltransferase [Betaproteobacteria bacterium]|nr:UDP-3-O-(3-hydroxymyristoyl)glucosamine N-acyltransferase [Betaproteobacteria bacterium]NBO44051.1 UDP-3-O-(3-hydroxymyristoyl)glucosamine N-acyltransferase [Betaproteobacteria bacterium]NBP11294.1 UDP-3-O-(3-hydroxymyristoyl)glucosamine N-acyltransferase [Betaproteobacteria bacterium]NBP62632.1 UDP-3-O-(3-hydroxymyristoyl)glucosamine N-acyltransferase [Betaproteobacteria bacterium]NBQ09943.1 UDP-3-O-(3-hydroxymyristoyl)glucosamine N-acyltransferase [Betaproteobacteria bacterium]